MRRYGYQLLVEFVHLDTTNPTVNSDVLHAFGVGQFWINTSTQTCYQCVSDTTGSAIWVQLSGSGGGGGGLPPMALTYAATTVVPSASTDWGTLVLTGNTNLNFTGSPIEGQTISVAATASGGSWAVTMGSQVDTPSSSSVTDPVTVASGTETIFSFRWSVSASKWRLVALVAGY